MALILFLSPPLSFSLAPSTQMLPAAQLDRSDGMCQLGIAHLSQHLTPQAGVVAGGEGGSKIDKRGILTSRHYLQRLSIEMKPYYLEAE